MDKVVVSKEVLEAFVFFMDMDDSKENRVKYWLNKKSTFINDYKPLKYIDMDTFIALLYDNYELEMTVDEKVMEEYERNLLTHNEHCNNNQRLISQGMISGIVYMNEMYQLGLKFDD